MIVIVIVSYQLSENLLGVDLHPGAGVGGAGGGLRGLLGQAQDDGHHLLPPLPHGDHFPLLFCSSHKVSGILGVKYLKYLNNQA